MILNNNFLNSNTIIAPEMDEIDVFGKLMEKYYDGVVYNEDTKELELPNSLIEEVMNQE